LASSQQDATRTPLLLLSHCAVERWGVATDMAGASAPPTGRLHVDHRARVAVGKATLINALARKHPQILAVGVGRTTREAAQR